jgi:hypothetical protein
VVIDDKLRILAAVKQQWGERVTTVFVAQGHYARDARELAAYPSADLRLQAIGELATLPAQLLPGVAPGRAKRLR